MVGGEAPPERPPELPVVGAPDRAGALAVPDLLVPLVCPEAGDVVAVGVVCAGGWVGAGAGLEDGMTVGTDGVGIGGSVGVLGTDGTLGVVGTSTVTTSTVTGPIVALTGAAGTAPVAVEISPADACAVAISDTTPAAHRATRADRERTRGARFESTRLSIPDWTAVSTS